MRLIGNSARNAVKNGARIGICGSLAGDTSLTGDFLRMGIDNFCVTPDRLAEVRKRVTEVEPRSITLIIQPQFDKKGRLLRKAAFFLPCGYPDVMDC